MIEDSIIRQILDGWAAPENHPFGDRLQRPLPSFHDVKEVFEQVFLASLKCEEGRPIRCSIVLASPSDIDDPSHQYNPSLRCIGTFGHGTPVLTALTSRKGSDYIDTGIKEYRLT
jgi:hypothetical protein